MPVIVEAIPRYRPILRDLDANNDGFVSHSEAHRFDPPEGYAHGELLQSLRHLLTPGTIMPAIGPGGSTTPAAAAATRADAPRDTPTATSPEEASERSGFWSGGIGRALDFLANLGDNGWVQAGLGISAPLLAMFAGWAVPVVAGFGLLITLSSLLRDVVDDNIGWHWLLKVPAAALWFLGLQSGISALSATADSAYSGLFGSYGSALDASIQSAASMSAATTAATAGVTAAASGWVGEVADVFTGAND
ncbi:MAG: hypothetical protein AAFQ65_14330 [Myxococcota bacterium]